MGLYVCTEEYPSVSLYVHAEEYPFVGLYTHTEEYQSVVFMYVLRSIHPWVFMCAPKSIHQSTPPDWSSGFDHIFIASVNLLQLPGLQLSWIIVSACWDLGSPRDKSLGAPGRG